VSETTVEFIARNDDGSERTMLSVDMTETPQIGDQITEGGKAYRIGRRCWALEKRPGYGGAPRLKLLAYLER
jgi:hypothetical protein